MAENEYFQWNTHLKTFHQFLSFMLPWLTWEFFRQYEILSSVHKFSSFLCFYFYYFDNFVAKLEFRLYCLSRFAKLIIKNFRQQLDAVKAFYAVMERNFEKMFTDNDDGRGNDENLRESGRGSSGREKNSHFYCLKRCRRKVREKSSKHISEAQWSKFSVSTIFMAAFFHAFLFDFLLPPPAIKVANVENSSNLDKKSNFKTLTTKPEMCIGECALAFNYFFTDETLAILPI